MKKSKVLLALSMTALLGFTGCSSQQVKLETGMSKVSDIKSYSYDTTLSVDASGLKNSLGTEVDSTVSSLLSAGKMSMNFNGKVLTKADRLTMSSNVKVSTGGVSFEAPIYIDSSTKKLDFDLFIGVPEILKSMIGGNTLGNVSNLYLSSKDLDSYVKKSGTEKEYKAYQDSIAKAFDTKSNKNIQVSKDMLLTLNSYIEKNKSKIKTFEKLDSAPVSKNGVYTIKLSKEDLKTIVSNYCNNKAYFTNLQEFLKEANTLSSASSEKKTLENIDAKTIIEGFNKGIDEAKALDIVTKVTIENNVATKTDVKVTVDTTAGKVVIEVDSKLSDINKVTSITAPDKNSDKTLNIMKLIDKMAVDGLDALEGLEN